MNGFISPKALRFTLVASACLLSGFVSGANFSGINFDALFSKKEINYSKISWISKVIEEEKITLATVDYPASEIDNKEIKLDQFQLPKRIFFAKKSKSKQNNFQRLNNVLAQINQKAQKKNSFDIFADYRIASQLIRKNFMIAASAPIQKVDTIVIASSSAVKTEVVPTQIENKITSLPKKIGSIKLNTQKLSIQTKPPIAKVTVKSNIESNKLVERQENKVITKTNVTTPEPITVKTTQSSAVSSNSIQEDENKTQDENFGNKIENHLLEQHILQYQKKQLIQKQVLALKTPKKVNTQTTKPEDQIDNGNDVQNVVGEPKDGHKVLQNKCKILPELNLIRPVPKDMGENTQICPAQKTWISKTWIDEGWAKVETEGYLPFITYYPQVNSSEALLLDQNAIAFLAIKSGIHITKGTGMILGTVPVGYKVEFLGRSEEVQYFDLNNKKYFILLNAESGAGVTELVSEKNEHENATVFTPVLSDTITYLDFAAPVVANIPIKIVKNAEKTNSDLIGLTVAISTQTQIQTKTIKNGLAILKNVRMIPGYPVFVDVSSKLNGERSYQYRYQLNKRTRHGVFVLNQYPEKLIFHWLKQIRTNLSDQSAMVFGQIQRNKIDGFKNNYSAKVTSISEKFGMNAKTFTVLWDEKLSEQDPLEGDRPRFLSVQVPEGLAQSHLVNEFDQIIHTTLIPVSPRVINVISE